MRLRPMVASALAFVLIVAAAPTLAANSRSSFPAHSPSTSCAPRYPKKAYTGPTQGRRVAITFDDSGTESAVRSVLRTLRDRRVRATFFLNGWWANVRPDLVRAIARGGHLIGNHTWSHPWLTRLSTARVRQEILRTHRLFRSLGVQDWPLFRFPFGAFDARTLRIVWGLGYRAFFWNVDSRGYAGAPVSSVVRNVVGAARPGSIILLHLHAASDVAALPQIIHGLREKNLRPVRIDELFYA